MRTLTDKLLKWVKKSQELNSFDEYQNEACYTRGTRGFRETLTMCGFGIAGEAGEVIELLKKTLFHGKPLDHEEMISELGDLLWYIAVTADTLGINLSEVVRYNKEKLRKRYPNGFVYYDKRSD